jgi:hypothetical protein
MDTDRAVEATLARIRALLGDYEQGKLRLTAMIAEVKPLIDSLPDSTTWKAVLSTELARIGSLWTGGIDLVQSTLTLGVERHLRDAVAALRKALGDAGGGTAGRPSG